MDIMDIKELEAKVFKQEKLLRKLWSSIGLEFRGDKVIKKDKYYLGSMPNKFITISEIIVDKNGKAQGYDSVAETLNHIKDYFFDINYRKYYVIYYNGREFCVVREITEEECHEY